MYQEGEVIDYQSDGENAGMKDLLSKFNDVDAVREQANRQHQRELAEQWEKEDAAFLSSPWGCEPS